MTGNLLIWIGGGSVAAGFLLLAFSRHFKIEKISVIGLEFRFNEPLESKGCSKLKLPGIAVLIAGLALSVYGSAKSIFVPTWPARFDDLKVAELQLSEVDDLMFVRINGQSVAQARYGEPQAKHEVTEAFQKGPNVIEVVIQNGQYGGCGGAVELQLNGLRNPDFKWTWFEQQSQLPGVVCFQRTKTVLLE